MNNNLQKQAINFDENYYAGLAALNIMGCPLNTQRDALGWVIKGLQPFAASINMHIPFIFKKRP